MCFKKFHESPPDHRAERRRTTRLGDDESLRSRLTRALSAVCFDLIHTMTPESLSGSRQSFSLYFHYRFVDINREQAMLSIFILLFCIQRECVFALFYIVYFCGLKKQFLDKYPRYISTAYSSIVDSLKASSEWRTQHTATESSTKNS